ncbi:MAG: aminoglycoside phosphotransferase family protein [Chloroflexi bacterium]|nr:aminoglycoside phosphotransferase family protein [Chloroflexota bacterium]
MRLELPLDFVQTIQNTFKERGYQFLSDLPALIDDASRRWSLKNIQPVPNLSYNFVAFATRSACASAAGTGERSGKAAQSKSNVVLKIGVPNPELTSEIAALRFFDGRGAARLLEADGARGMFLMERVEPGKMLASLEDDDRATHIAANVMLNLWRPAPTEGAFIKLSDWFKGFEKLRAASRGGTGPFEKSLVERAERAATEFFSEDYAPMLIHGDLHHFNILLSKDSWLAIDPKGVTGPAAYEVGPLLINPWSDETKISQHTERRIAILAERLGFEHERILEWGLAHAVLSAWWSLEENSEWKFAMAFAEILSEIKL